MKICLKVEDQLGDYVDGLCASKERRMIEAHLKECGNCTQVKREIEELLLAVSAIPSGISRAEIVIPSMLNAVELGTDEDEVKDQTDEGGPLEKDVATIEEALAIRDFERCGKLLEYYRPAVAAMDPAESLAARMLACDALYLEMTNSHYRIDGEEFPCLELVKGSLRRLGEDAWSRLPNATCDRLRLARGIVDFLSQKYETSIESLKLVTASNPDMGIAAHFVAAKCHTRQGNYQEGSKEFVHARELAVQYNRTESAAAVRVWQCWTMMQQGHHNEARCGLEEVLPTLEAIEDHCSVGDAHAFLARMYKREGRVSKALDHYELAAGAYKRLDPSHQEIGRVKTRKAATLRLMASRLLKNGYRQNIEAIGKLHGLIFSELRDADAIFLASGNRRGAGEVAAIRAAVHIDRGRIHEGWENAMAGYEIGVMGNYPIVTARTALELCKMDHGRGENPCEEAVPGYHAARALEWATRALEEAEKTENLRLRARAWTWRGIILAGNYFQDFAEARRCYEKAEELLKPRGGDCASAEFEILSQLLMTRERLLVDSTIASLETCPASRRGLNDADQSHNDLDFD